MTWNQVRDAITVQYNRGVLRTVTSMNLTQTIYPSAKISTDLMKNQYISKRSDLCRYLVEKGVFLR